MAQNSQLHSERTEEAPQANLTTSNADASLRDNIKNINTERGHHMTMTTDTHVLSPEAEAYLARVNGGVGTMNVAWTGEVEPAAKHRGVVLTKIVHATVLTGVEYPNLLVNKDRETGSLPWGQWLVYPHLIGHKGTEYARMNTVDGTLRTSYFVDGREVPREAFEAYLTPGARKLRRPHGGTISVKLANVTIL